MNYAQKYDLFFPFFIKVVDNKSNAYSFLIIGMMHLQKNITLSYNAAIPFFFTAKQGTWVHKDDRGPWIIRVHLSQSTHFRVTRIDSKTTHITHFADIFHYTSQSKHWKY